MTVTVEQVTAELSLIAGAFAESQPGKGHYKARNAGEVIPPAFVGAEVVAIIVEELITSIIGEANDRYYNRGRIHVEKMMTRVAPAFGFEELALPPHTHFFELANGNRSDRGSHLVSFHRDGTDMFVSGDFVVFTLPMEVSTMEQTYKPKTQWIDVDDMTKKLVPVLDADENPVMEKAERKEDTASIVVPFAIPIQWFVDLLNEVGRDSFMTAPPKNYIPEPLGEAMMSFFPSIMSAINPTMMLDDGWGGHPRDLREWNRSAGIAMMRSMPPMMINNPVPSRIFLKPEEGTNRTEIVFEPYTKDELRDNRDIRNNRQRWAEWRFKDTNGRVVGEVFNKFFKDAVTAFPKLPERSTKDIVMAMEAAFVEQVGQFRKASPLNPGARQVPREVVEAAMAQYAAGQKPKAPKKKKRAKA